MCVFCFLSLHECLYCCQARQRYTSIVLPQITAEQLAHGLGRKTTYKIAKQRSLPTSLPITPYLTYLTTSPPTSLPPYLTPSFTPYLPPYLTPYHSLPHPTLFVSEDCWPKRRSISNCNPWTKKLQKAFMARANKSIPHSIHHSLPHSIRHSLAHSLPYSIPPPTSSSCQWFVHEGCLNLSESPKIPRNAAKFLVFQTQHCQSEHRMQVRFFLTPQK